MKRIIDKNLKLENGSLLTIDEKYLKPLEEEINDFINSQEYMQQIDFAKQMLSVEIKYNNTIEGIYDELSFIEEVIQNNSSPESKKRKRILNLYRGYKYILTHDNINAQSLKELYQILSDGLLSDYDLQYMGQFYRQDAVYIYKTANIFQIPYKGVDENKLEEYMNSYFEYVNRQESLGESKFLKSQIMHFYFVYIHPYFDVNGRTSRTLAMWYLLNNKLYPYIIFNHAISFLRKDYINSIIKSRETGDLTFFLQYILNSVYKELEKEYIINNIKNIYSNNLTKEEIEIIQYVLTIKGNLTIKDIVTFYNQYNPKRSVEFIYNTRIKPLLAKNILLFGNETNSYINSNFKNCFLYFNPKLFDIDCQKLKYLDIKRLIK